VHCFSSLINAASGIRDRIGRARILHGFGRQHDLADVFARLHQAVRRGRIFEREGAVDDGLDDALFEERPDFPTERDGDFPFFGETVASAVSASTLASPTFETAFSF